MWNNTFKDKINKYQMKYALEKKQNKLHLHIFICLITWFPRNAALRGWFLLHNLHEGGGGPLPHSHWKSDLHLRQGEWPLAHAGTLCRQADQHPRGGRGSCHQGAALCRDWGHYKQYKGILAKFITPSKTTNLSNKLPSCSNNLVRFLTISLVLFVNFFLILYFFMLFFFVCKFILLHHSWLYNLPNPFTLTTSCIFM